MAGGPLAGIKVLEIGQAFAGPLAGAIFADMGADVIKVEKPDGGDDARLWGPPFVGDDSAMFHSNNRGKKSVTLDIKNPTDVARLFKLAGAADILIQNLRPGIVDDCGIGPDAMLAAHPRLIYCSIWAFGAKGPLRLAPGFDPLLQAFGAVMTMTGRPQDPPTFCAPAINDAATGLWCVIGALAALQQRHSTGRGCVIDTSLFETASHWVSGALTGYHLSGKVPERHGTASALLAPYQIFDTADRPICIAAGNDRLFVKCAAALGHPEWAQDPRFEDGRQRVANRAALIAAMEPVLRGKPRDAWMAALTKVGVPCAPVNDVAELANSEQMQAVDLMRTLPGSNMKVVGLPISFDGTRPHPRNDSPTLGEHNAEVLGKIE
ncbi:CaiB/BaiF CoA-transferase family protein [Reyranella sp. CPCC 100927]|uniref:CaiB/BaiF CoA transferase family protein n=1 Tax=Reyranella sp. CPCC 100927 TaxID=2599616 RepID=UPI0011B4E7E8|nr:CoA transferase [Reyranella sp. CPCC 100927]TWT15159.1 CoA transferase [Reyranella sp. CPCC 100927]